MWGRFLTFTFEIVLEKDKYVIEFVEFPDIG